MKSLLGDEPGDPLAAKLREVARRGRVGAIVTRLETAPDFQSVTVEATLWVRTGADRWQAAIVRPATIRPGELRPDAGAPLANDPQVQAVFKVIEGLGLGQIPPEMKRQSLNVGAATQKALGLARSALQADLEALALPVSEGGRRP